jgi:hypothetical protein
VCVCVCVIIIFCGAGAQTQVLTHARQIFYPWATLQPQLDTVFEGCWRIAVFKAMRRDEIIWEEDACRGLSPEKCQ